MLIVSVAVAIAAFMLVRLVPGDPARLIAGPDANPGTLKSIRAQLNLDRPLPQQLGEYLSGLTRGDLGQSLATREPVREIISQRLPKTIELASFGFLVTIVIGVPLGALVAGLTEGGRRRGLDLAFGSASSLVGAVPDYVFATIFALVFGLWLAVLPVAGSEGYASVVLPALAVGIPAAALLARVVRVETATALAQDYVRTARSKRLPTWRLYIRHVLPNALSGALSVSGLVLAALLGGTIVVENVFDWPGLGSVVFDAIQKRDYPVVQGVVLVLGIGVVAINTLVDLVGSLLDPRIRRRTR